MELTTVQDNQTTASIDLYRSESGTMEDAEYVDTLELSDLAPHPGGETCISFTIQLHEDNTLSAEVVDAESGKTSATKSDLVNLPPEKKQGSADDAPAALLDTDFEEPPLPEAPVVDGGGEEPEETLVQDKSSQPPAEDSAGIADFNLPDLDLDDFSSVDSLPSDSAQADGASEDSFPTFEDDSPEESHAVSEIPATIDDLPDFGDVSLDLGGDSAEEAPAFNLDSLDLDDFTSVDSVQDAESLQTQGEDAAGELDSAGSDALLAAGAGAAALGLGAAAIAAADKDEHDDSHLDALLGKDDATMESTSFDLPDFDGDGLAGDDAAAADSGLDAASFDLPDFDEAGLASDDTVADSGLDATSFDLPDFDGDGLAGDDTAAAGSGLDATSFDLPDFDEAGLAGDDTAADSGLDATSFDLPDFDEAGLAGDDAAAADSGLDATSFDLPDFDEAGLAGDDTAATGSGVDATSFDLPDFDFENDGSEFDSSRQDTAVYEDSLPDFSKFELPDFDEPVRNDFSFGEESGLFNENDFQDPAFYTAATSSASPLDFSGLYDDRESELKQQENRRKRGGISVAVCIVCALICVGILLFILFLLPARLSDSRNAGNQVSVLDSHTVTVSQQEMEAQPDSTAAVEDVIVIVETPAVVPAPPPQVAKEPEAVRYEVKWGDTLWDIAQSYYNNPWLYKRIATANNIKNPDHIVAGIILTIPPQ